MYSANHASLYISAEITFIIGQVIDTLIYILNKQGTEEVCRTEEKNGDYVQIIPVVFSGMLIEKADFRSMVTRNQFIRIWLFRFMLSLLKIQYDLKRKKA